MMMLMTGVCRKRRQAGFHASDVRRRQPMPFHPELIPHLLVDGLVARRRLDQGPLALPQEAQLVVALPEERGQPLVQQDLDRATDEPVEVPASGVRGQEPVPDAAGALQDLPADGPLKGEEMVVEAGNQLVLVLYLATQGGRFAAEALAESTELEELGLLRGYVEDTPAAGIVGLHHPA